MFESSNEKLDAFKTRRITKLALGSLRTSNEDCNVCLDPNGMKFAMKVAR